MAETARSRWVRGQAKALYILSSVLSTHYVVIVSLSFVSFGLDYESRELLEKFHPHGVGRMWFELSKIMCCVFVLEVESCI